MSNLLVETIVPKNSILQKEKIDISALTDNKIKGILYEWRSKNIYFRHFAYSLNQSTDLEVAYKSDYIQFIFLQEGKSITCLNPSGKDFFSLKKSEFAFFKHNQNQNRTIKISKANKIEICVVNLTENYFNTLLGNNVDLKTSIDSFNTVKAFSRTLITTEIYDCLARLKQIDFDCTSFDYSYFELKGQELILLSLYQYGKQHLLENTTIEDEEHKKMLTIGIYLENNLDQNHSLKKLAELVYTNTTYVKLNFKKTFNKSVFEFLNMRRMQKASAMLKTKQHSIAEIANSVGYKHSTHFSSAFKKFYGILPSTINKLYLLYLFLV